MDTTEPNQDELTLFNEISNLGSILWEKSAALEGLNIDPKILSALLYKRLWSHHKGYAILWTHRQVIEADIVLRSGLEAAICIAANRIMGKDFYPLMRRDAAATITGQIKQYREEGEDGMVRAAEAVLRDLRAEIPAGTKPSKLDMKSLASVGGVPQLYGFYRMLSGVSSHVTGLSILRGATNDQLEVGHRESNFVERRVHFMMMAAATLNGAMLHAGMIEDHSSVGVASSLADRMNVLTMAWPK